MLAELLDRLEAFYGPQAWIGPQEPYAFLIWLNCGYPPGDDACAKGFDALEAAIGEPTGEAILAAREAVLAKAVKAGGMVPDLRAKRLKEIATLVHDAYAGDLGAALRVPLAEARRILKRFPTIGEPAADRILLFCGLEPVVVAPAGPLHVPLRLGLGVELKDWGKTYASVRQALEGEIPPEFAARRRAYLLLKAHGQGLCRRAAPRCEDCPLKSDCRYFQEVVRPAALSPG